MAMACFNFKSLVPPGRLRPHAQWGDRQVCHSALWRLWILKLQAYLGQAKVAFQQIRA